MLKKHTPDKGEIFRCNTCDVTCKDKYKYNRHLLTARHLRRGHLERPHPSKNDLVIIPDTSDHTCSNDCGSDTCEMTTSLTPGGSLEQGVKNMSQQIYFCVDCDYTCSKKRDYNRHITTAKHNYRTELKLKGEKGETQCYKTYGCENCDKVYHCRNSLWYHAKLCTNVSTAPPTNNIIIYDNTNTTDTNTDHTMVYLQTMLASQAEAHAAQIAVLIGAQTQQTQTQAQIVAQTVAQTVAQISAQTQAHADAQAEQIKLLIEAISLQGPHTVTNNNNNTTNNNQFNLNVFLNEDCKDAFTFKDVIESIVCTVDDLDRLIVEGYAATVIRKILESMQDMAITERPIHCTDLRRNTVCVKNATGWEKGEAALKRLNNSLYFIGKKLSNVVPEWRETYPDHFRGTDSRRNQYHTLIVEVLKVDDVKLEDRNVGIICRSLVLDRKTAKAGIM